MATPSEEVVQSINSALERVKYDIFKKTDNGHTLGDISRTITKLQAVCESVVKSNYGSLRQRYKHELIPVYPLLQRQMISIKNSIVRRLKPRMSKVHPWMICFDVSMALEIFEILRKHVLGITSYGLEIEETEKKVVLKFTSLRRLQCPKALKYN